MDYGLALAKHVDCFSSVTLNNLRLHWNWKPHSVRVILLGVMA